MPVKEKEGREENRGMRGNGRWGESKSERVNNDGGWGVDGEREKKRVINREKERGARRKSALVARLTVQEVAPI